MNCTHGKPFKNKKYDSSVRKNIITFVYYTAATGRLFTTVSESASRKELPIYIINDAIPR